MPTSRSRNILLANRQIAHIIYYNNVLLSFCTCLEKHTDRLQFDLYTASAGKHMWVSTKAAQCWYIHDGTAARGGWGMQAATEMQVIGLMLTRCDSLLERQTGSRNTTKHRAGAGSTPEEPFPASHGDNAENTAFKCNTQTEPAIKRHRVRHSSETDRVHEQRSTAAFYVCASGHLSPLICRSSQRRTRLSSSDSTMLHLHSLPGCVGGI